MEGKKTEEREKENNLCKFLSFDQYTESVKKQQNISSIIIIFFFYLNP